MERRERLPAGFHREHDAYAPRPDRARPRPCWRLPPCRRACRCDRGAWRSACQSRARIVATLSPNSPSHLIRVQSGPRPRDAGGCHRASNGPCSTDAPWRGHARWTMSSGNPWPGVRSDGFGLRVAASCVLFAAAAPVAAQRVISECRRRRPNGVNDGLIEIHNDSGSDHAVAALSGVGYANSRMDRDMLHAFSTQACGFLSRFNQEW